MAGLFLIAGRNVVNVVFGFGGFPAHDVEGQPADVRGMRREKAIGGMMYAIDPLLGAPRVAVAG